MVKSWILCLSAIHRSTKSRWNMTIVLKRSKQHWISRTLKFASFVVQNKTPNHLSSTHKLLSAFSILVTGDKSPGWLNMTTHLPSKSASVISPKVVTAVNCGALYPICGKLARMSPIPSNIRSPPVYVFFPFIILRDVVECVTINGAQIKLSPCFLTFLNI
jgi:hypothetical protein